MVPPKKVAIIGAGPSGLVTAKTLLHSFPEGTFIPSVFEKNHRIGGLWPAGISSHGGDQPQINPWIRTNLSRFTVAFSDLAWESVVGEEELSMFPQARQVGMYLEKYAGLYIPKGVLRLGKEVVRTVREVDGVGGRWTVQWVSKRVDGDGVLCEGSEVESEQFDYLVVTSGYFAKAHFPDIPGLASVADKVVHSSEVQTTNGVQQLLERTGSKGGKVVVIGGSMSGVEAASTVALNLSTMDFRPPVVQSGREFEVHHICSRPFWTVPTYLPHTGFQDTKDSQITQFLPLDFVFYDLARRPPGPVEYNLTPLSTQQIRKSNAYFRSLLGDDYAKIGSFGIDSNENDDPQPPWIAIGDDYAEYVRSGFIKVTIGRVSSIDSSSTLTITLPNSEQQTISDITAIITATGYTPFSALSFLSPSVLSTLEYSTKDPFLPLILDGKGTSHADIPDLGFVGFYRGPYWGAMEMQARSLASTWARDSGPYFSHEQLLQRSTERDFLRSLRSNNQGSHRSQFPMGDYIGLMESLARDLNIPRAPISTNDPDSNPNPSPVIPSRYIPSPFLTHNPEDRLSTLVDRQRTSTLQSLQNTIIPGPSNYNLGMGNTIFRALHGAWKYTRTITTTTMSSSSTTSIFPTTPHPTSPSSTTTTTGHATFHPRRTSSPGYEKEYVYDEIPTESLKSKTRSIYRLVEGTWSKTNGQILIWNVDMDPYHAGSFSHGVIVGLAEEKDEKAEVGMGRYVVRATAGGIPIQRERAFEPRYEYVFVLEGVSVVEWVCLLRERVGGGGGGVVVSRTVYTR
ncbi:uncharacterized protein BO80DRAFT_468030 [Aspergillus ibericus CBS 121593]|uniref:FAD/NAD(P)-binding domain-containing protein n=1 Tax=Aspergillus ibericus CBS 121593 TaxID=1448316 RepID=A0A395GP48_9EURO|nr:hypothetical protein BO80DRAFT_468030 [Aspergillus ibericus CBS 121593]RAK97122.1 hypothetical protein BO80DRAFT_468030 [Aspergillus ibericus CBS 121593]